LVFQKHLKQIQEIRSLKWIGYLSSTGVYGNHNGDWVTETSSLLATENNNLARIQSEQQWLTSFPKHAHIFRLSGIYGPGRSPLESVLNGSAKRIYKDNQYFSRIHVKDIASILQKSMQLLTPGEIFNLADDLPAPSYKVIEHYCDHLNLPYPELVDYQSANLSPMGMQFYNSNKKVSNLKIKEILNYDFIYKTYMDCLD
jgi:nucleoside-diphosphate-sugar epimerase